VWPKKVYNVLNFIGRLSTWSSTEPVRFQKRKNNKNLETKLQRVWCDHENKIKRKTTENEKKTHGVPV
jgi:hypothetical protein